MRAPSLTNYEFRTLSSISNRAWLLGFRVEGAISLAGRIANLHLRAYQLRLTTLLKLPDDVFLSDIEYISRMYDKASFDPSLLSCGLVEEPNTELDLARARILAALKQPAEDVTAQIERKADGRLGIG